MKISVVTPCYNSESFLEETILSVLNQSYDELEYIVIDGKSSDGTLAIINRYKKHLKYWHSKPDRGMYDAINTGFEHATGDIYCWINSDDLLLPGALSTVAEAFSKNSNTNWLHGRSAYTDASTGHKKIAPLYLYHRANILRGYHGMCARYIQQHCCFWRKELWKKCGPIPTELRYAGDYWLWLQFARLGPLVSLNYPVAAFRQHENQLHKDGDKYFREMNRHCNSSKFQLLFRKSLRLISRRFDFDTQILDFIFHSEPYQWIDPEDEFKLKTSTRSLIV